MTTKYTDPGDTAFPSSEEQTYGMRMREWYAGQALTGLLAAGQFQGVRHEPDNVERAERLARHAFTLADAMLAEAARRQP